MSNTAIALTEGWEMASTLASTLDRLQTPADITGLAFTAAKVPATVASILRDGKQWQRGSGMRFDACDHWFRCRFTTHPALPEETLLLSMKGIATVAEVWLNGQLILQSNSMFVPYEVDVTNTIQTQNELVIVCRSLTTALREKRRQQPASRWRTRVVAEQQLRWFRTTLLGRAPGFAPEPEPVGPWRLVNLLRRSGITIDDYFRKVYLDGDTGVIEVKFHAHGDSGPISGTLKVGEHSTPLQWDGTNGHATLRIPSVEKWWPHTHGAPALYPVQVTFGGTIMEDIPTGFRSIDSRGEGLGVHVNDVPVFCRGVAWMPPDAVALSAPHDVIRRRLELLRDGGINMIRLAGTTVYEDDTFHKLCDELGLLVWQDMMFANMDYPFADEAFHTLVSAEANRELSRLARHPSTAVVCGNSEIEQQVAMMGLDPTMGRGTFFGDQLPTIVARCCPGVPYIPSAPYGGDLPFHTRSGVANYFGVGAYLRPLEDVRRAEVHFASECLAFANVPEPEMVEAMAVATPGGISPTHPAWKRGVPRDGGAGWDFEDVRDHYLKLLFSVDPATVRYADANRYWDLSRMVSGEVMTEVFGEWRRPQSPCGGGIILWSSDLEPGAGWGILDSAGDPKSAYWFLKRALAPRTVWTTDEGLNGIDVHASNDTPQTLHANLRVALYRNSEKQIEEASHAVVIPPHQSITIGVDRMFGRFVDAAYAYRFGPPGHDLVVASLYFADSKTPIAQSFRYPLGRTAQRLPMTEIGLTGHCSPMKDGRIEVELRSRRLAYGVRVSAKGYRADDAYFSMEPGVPRRMMLIPVEPGAQAEQVVVTAINAEGRLSLTLGAKL